MGCFDNIIGLREGCDTTTKSGYYIEDFNLTKTEIEQIATAESQNVNDFLTQKIGFITNVVTNNLVSHFSFVKANTLVKSHRVGIFNKNMVPDASGDYRGIHFSLTTYKEYLNFDIAEINTLTDFTGSLPIVVYDLLQNKLLDTFTISSTADTISSTFPHKSYQTNKQQFELFVGYDSSGITPYKSTIRSGSCCGNYTCSNRIVTSKGVSTSSTFVNEALTTLDNTAGLSVLYSVSCDNKSWLCSYLNQIALAVGYKLCSDIMQKGYSSSSLIRTNDTVTLNRDLLLERHEFYEGEYIKTMDNLMKNISTPQSSVCFSCNSPVYHKTVLP